ncbi:MAG: protein-disulfide reductase DsbD family protein [Gemmatimonadota bacterium]
MRPTIVPRSTTAARPPSGPVRRALKGRRVARGLAALAALGPGLGLGGPASSPPPALGQEAELPPATRRDLSPHSDAVLVSGVSWVRPGEPFTVGLRLTLEPEWHSYWMNPGDSGEATSITWRLPDGFSAGPIQWPVPHRISFPPLVSYGYFDEVLLPVEITPPAGLVPGDTVRLAGRADWLVCIEDCFPAEAELSLALPVRDAPPGPDPETAAFCARARARMPVADPRWSAEARGTESWIGLRVRPPADFQADGVTDLHFFVAVSDVVDHAAEQRWGLEEGALAVRLARSGFATGFPDTLRGVLVVREPGDDAAGRLAVEIAAPMEVAPSPAAGAAGAAGEAGAAGAADADGAGGAASSLGLGLALLFAILGGLILNLMPCVFPVLGLKVLGFVEHAEEGRGGAARQGGAFAAGVLASFWVLGGLLLVLRAAGESVGWGFQLQSPLFVGAMALLFFLLALVLLGVVEVGAALTRFGGIGTGKIPSGTRTDPESRKVPSPDRAPRKRTFGSFGAGVLATVVATPCTAPFMGAALGWALFRPPTETMLVFTALGAGMAAPYLAFSLSPSLVERMPRPGRWMESLKQALAFPLLATVVWLAWVFGLQVGVDGLTGLLAALLLVGLGVWVAGRWGGLDARPRRRVVARTAAIVAGLGAAFLLVRAAGSTDESGIEAAAVAGEPPAASGGVAGIWRSWSASAAAEARAAGEALFLDFTAAWCLSCQVNERVVLNTAEIRDAFRTHGVTLMKADWTRRDPAISAALAALGRSSVPVYALYPAGQADPVLLPSVLTKDIVLDALAVHAPTTEPDGG